MSKTRIIDAVRHLDLEATRALLKASSDLLSVRDRQGRNLLHVACAVPCSSLKKPEVLAARMVRLLLDRGLDVNSTSIVDRGPYNAVWFAAARGRNATVIKLLLARGATPNGLFAAGWYEDLEILDMLIRAGAPVDTVAGETPFLACWKWKKFESAKFLARQGADVNFQDKGGRTALHHGVAKAYDPALLEFLVKSGASPDIIDHDGVSPRMMASRKRDKRFLAALA